MDSITKIFPGVVALDKVHLRVKPGHVHALMGENGAGKSTLMKCLFGMYAPDGGTIHVDGEELAIPDTHTALQHGISMIHQELNPIPHRPVMENIWLGRFPMRGIMVDHKRMENMTRDLFKRLEINIDPTAMARDLSASELQLCDIAKAVSYSSRIIIMDEPTSSLTENEVEHLFTIIRRLREEGVSMIYISHKMEEILTIADEVTIMRDGQYVGTWPSAELTTDKIIQLMVGRDMSHRIPPKTHTPSEEVILEVRNLTSDNPRSFRDVSFTLRKGEILGIGGLVGAQRTELVEAIFGLRAIESGQIFRKGKEVSIASPRQARDSMMALLTEERRATGIFGMLSILENTAIANQDRYAFSSIRIIREKKRVKEAAESVRKLNVKTPSLKTLIQNLSGGNQQKVLLARWLLTEPEVLILDEPTRGIDVGSKYEIYVIMHELVKQGKSIIMISSEMPELLGMADRVMVMCEGRVSGILDAAEATQEQVMRLATEFM